METVNPNRYNNTYIGIVAGIIGPVAGFWLFYLLKFSYRTPEYYVNLFFTAKQYQSPILSLSLIINLAIFFLFLKFNLNKTALGVLYATFLYLPVVVYLKFF